MRQFAGLVGAAAGTGTPRISRVSGPMLRLAGVFVPPVREMVEMVYEFDAPHVLDSSKIERTFGLTATPFAESIATIVTWWQRHGVASRRPAGS